MVTFQQHLRKSAGARRRYKFHKVRTKALKGCPQKRGVVNRIVTESPKKPNSAKRRVAKIRLCTGKRLRVKVPGIGQGSIQKFTPILIRGAHPRDLPGIRYSIIRGKLGASPVFERRKARSKYGMKRKYINDPNPMWKRLFFYLLFLI